MVKLTNQSLPSLAFLCLYTISVKHTTVGKAMIMIMKAVTMPAMMAVVETATVYRETILNTHYTRTHIPITSGVVIGETLLCTVICSDMLTAVDVSIKNQHFDSNQHIHCTCNNSRQ